ncbi:MAG: thioredoxin family protein [Limnochordales bacterium]|nr:thioredoxin family protein [Limnochordales bacterium]
MTSPVLERLSNELEVPIYVIDVNRYQSTWQQYDIRGTPTVVRFEGGRERTRIVGQQAEATWRRLLEEQRLRLGG